MRRLILACFTFSALLFCCPPKTFAYYDKNISAEGEITLFAAGAKGGLFDNQENTLYKSSEALLYSSVTINSDGNFYLLFNPYFSFDYNNYYEGKTTSGYFNFARAAAVYDNDIFFLEGGRFDFSTNNLNPFIYYGQYQNIDNRRPASLDGARAKARLGTFWADFILARPSHDGETQYVAGGVVGRQFFGLLTTQAFYYQKKEDCLNLSLYGAGFDFTVEDFLLSAVLAFNGGTRSQVYKTKTKEYSLNNYALSVNTLFSSEGDLGRADFGFNLFYTPSREENFVSVSQNLDMGFIFGGLQMDGQNLLQYYTQMQQNEMGLNATSLKFNFRPHFMREVLFSSSVYSFNAPSLGRHLGNEIDFALSYGRANFKAAFLLGLFYGGDMTSEGNIKLSSAQGGNIFKAGLNFTYALPF